MIKVLIIDRQINPEAWIPDGLQWVDSSGSRSVFYWDPLNQGYENATDLPEPIFRQIEKQFNRLKETDPDLNLGLCIRREDPGLGIFIPEIDNPVIASGQLPDGCIRINQSPASISK